MSARQRSCGEAIVAALEAHGVEAVFGIPGTHTLDIHDPLAHSEIRHVAPRHEQGGGYAADGYARATGRPGVCLVTTGPGVTNLMTAAATSYHDSVPVLIITPGMPTDLEGTDAGFLHQVKNQSGAVANLLAWSRRVSSAEEAVAAIDDAFGHFATSRPRPVHIEVPLEVLEASRTAREADTRVERIARPAPADSAVGEAADLLAAARSPFILLGGGAIAAGEEARLLAERLGAVVVTTVNAKGVLPESHPLSIGASLRLELAREALAGADVVLAVGTELSESELWTRRLALSGRLIRVDLDPRQLEKNAPAAVAIQADAALTMAALAERLPPAHDSDGADRAAALRQRIAAQVASDGAPYALLHRVLRETLRPDAILTGDSSMVSYYGSVHQFPLDLPRRFLYPVGYATLGYSLPAAIGAKLGNPETEVVAVDGDGGFLFSATELATAAELGLSLPVIVFDNGGYGEIRDQMLERGAEPLGVDMAAVDFPALGRSLGTAGEQVPYEEGALAEALRSALGRPGPTLLAIDARDAG